MQQEQVLKTRAPKTAIRLEVDELLSVINAFSNLLQKETTALKEANYEVIDNLQSDKKLFAKQYEAKVNALVSRRDEILALDLPTREKLAAQRTLFNEVLEKNMHALELAQGSNKRLVHYILESARSYVSKERETNYSNTAVTNTYKSALRSTSVDEVL